MKILNQLLFPLIVFITALQLISCRQEAENKIITDSLKTAPLRSDSVLKKDSTENTVDVHILRKDSASGKEDKVKLEVYYFHPTARCQSCINIENFTREVIETGFRKELKKGKIIFREYNIEDSVNGHYIDDYKLESSSVILAKYINNRKSGWKNLEHVWKYANDKDAFTKYTVTEIRKFLKEEKKND